MSVGLIPTTLFPLTHPYITHPAAREVKESSLEVKEMFGVSWNHRFKIVLSESCVTCHSVWNISLGQGQMLTPSRSRNSKPQANTNHARYTKLRNGKIHRFVSEKDLIDDTIWLFVEALWGEGRSAT